eukprot:40795-Pleurochrysis_carterae.AAC.3
MSWCWLIFFYFAWLSAHMRNAKQKAKMTKGVKAVQSVFRCGRSPPRNSHATALRPAHEFN